MASTLFLAMTKTPDWTRRDWPTLKLLSRFLPPRQRDKRLFITVIGYSRFDCRPPALDALGTVRPHFKREQKMPLVRIDLIRGKPAAFRKSLGEIVYKAMTDLINVPANDKFQIITEHAAEEINVADSYLGNDYSQDIILIQITMNTGRTVDMKKALFKRIADDLHDQLKVRREDVFINLVEVTKENWSFGGGIAQYAT
jgi:4-oxalocrotonate tautomerase